MDADLLDQFVETTGSTMAEAMKYLKLCDNDINAAVGCYFDPTVVSLLTETYSTVFIFYRHHDFENFVPKSSTAKSYNINPPTHSSEYKL